MSKGIHGFDARFDRESLALRATDGREMFPQ
jgi:hypothetical protein